MQCGCGWCGWLMRCSVRWVQHEQFPVAPHRPERRLPGDRGGTSRPPTSSHTHTYTLHAVCVCVDVCVWMCVCVCVCVCQSPLVPVDEDGRQDDDVFTRVGQSTSHVCMFVCSPLDGLCLRNGTYIYINQADGADEEGRGGGIQMGPTEDSSDDYEVRTPKR